MGFRVLVSRHPAIQATGLLTVTPAGLAPAEHASLRWTHNRAGGSPAHGSPVGSFHIGTGCRTASQGRIHRSALPRQPANPVPGYSLWLAWIVPASRGTYQRDTPCA